QQGRQERRLHARLRGDVSQRKGPGRLPGASGPRCVCESRPRSTRQGCRLRLLDRTVALNPMRFPMPQSKSVRTCENDRSLKQWPRLAVVLLGWLALAGCGESLGTVAGTVSFDGQPVTNGSVAFVKNDGQISREGAVISNGAFQAKLQPGEYRVE